MSILRSSFIAFLVMLLPTLAAAQQGAPLAEEEVRRFLATLPALEEIGQRHEDSGLGETDIDPERGFAPMASALDELRGHAAYPEFQEAVRAEGFRDEDRWAEVGDRTLRAYMALQIEEENPGMMDELRGALAEMERDPDVSEEQRAMMMQMMGPMLLIARSIEEVPEEDLRTVTALRPEIESMLQE